MSAQIASIARARTLASCASHPCQHTRHKSKHRLGHTSVAETAATTHTRSRGTVVIRQPPQPSGCGPEDSAFPIGHQSGAIRSGCDVACLGSTPGACDPVSFSRAAIHIAVARSWVEQSGRERVPSPSPSASPGMPIRATAGASHTFIACLGRTVLLGVFSSESRVVHLCVGKARSQQ